MEKEIEYDIYGRMKYNPEFHSKTGTPWTKEDLEYLITWYKVISSEEMSFALERTVKSIREKARHLRDKGIMERPKKNPLQRVQK